MTAFNEGEFKDPDVTANAERYLAPTRASTEPYAVCPNCQVALKVDGTCPLCEKSPSYWTEAEYQGDVDDTPGIILHADESHDYKPFTLTSELMGLAMTSPDAFKRAADTFFSDEPEDPPVQTERGMNPKDAQAVRERKTRLDLLEPVGNKAIADALEFGAVTKGYGVENYKQVEITARAYLAAMQRHIDALKRGEDLAPDSLIHHLGHIGANVHVWLGALEAGTFVDDRGPGPVGPNPLNDLGVK